MHARLSLMLFMQFAVMGGWWPVLSQVLQDLHFSPVQQARILATNAIGAIFAPVIWSQIADRWLATERCIGICAFVGGCMLWHLSWLETPVPMFWAFLVCWLFQIPVISLGSSLIFRHLDHPEKHFSKIRRWGTSGWVIAGLLLTYGLTNPDWLQTLIGRKVTLGDSMRWGACLDWVVAAMSLTLPHTPPLPGRAPPTRPDATGWRVPLVILARAFDAPLQALTLLRRRSFSIYCLALFGVNLTMAFTTQMTALLLIQIGIPKVDLPSVLTIAQLSEVMLLGSLPIVLARLGQKRTMIVGMLAWLVILTGLSIGQPSELILGVLTLHGFFVTCFLVAGQVFVNQQAEHHYRASVQGLLVLVQGIGLLSGNLAVGAVREWVGEDYACGFRPAAVGMGILTVVFVLGFRGGEERTAFGKA